jgi:hypothetical protein
MGEMLMGSYNPTQQAIVFKEFLIPVKKNRRQRLPTLALTI